MLAPFRSRNFRLYFFGQWISLTGTWMTNTAMVWLVYDLTGSPMWLAIVGMASQLPMVVAGPFAGVLVDRVDRLRLLTVLQVLMMSYAVALAALTFSGMINQWWLLALALFHGFVHSVDVPTRQSMTMMLAERRENLTGVIALNASMFHGARVIGPAVAGFMIASFGAAVCFAADATSYIAVLACLGVMRNPAGKSPPAATTSGVLGQLREGVAYASGSFPLRWHLGLTGAMGFFVLSYAALMPMYADVFFGGSARTLGLMMTSTAVGALTAALYLASRRRLAGIGSVITAGAGLCGLGLLGFAFSRDLWTSCALLTIVGFGGILVMAANNTVVQSLVEEDKRGRVMSLYGVLFSGGLPLGSLWNGWLASTIAPQAVPIFTGISALIITVIFVRMRPRLRTAVRAVLQANPDAG